MVFFIRLFQLKIIAFTKKWKLLNIIIGCTDIFAITLAFQFAYTINYYKDGFFFFSQSRLVELFLIIMPVWLVVLYLMQISEIPRTKRYRTLFIEYMQSAIVIALFLLIFYFVFRDFDISRRLLVEFTFLGFLFLLIARMVEYILFKTYRAKGFNFLNIAVIADETSIGFIERLRSFPEWGYRIAVIFSDSDKINEQYMGKIELMPFKSTDSLQNLMENDTIDEVLYIKDQINPPEVRRTIRSCEEYGVIFRLLTRDNHPRLTNAFISTLANEKFLTFINVPYKPLGLAVKKFMDIYFSVLLLIFFSPLILIIALAIFFTSKGPVIYCQERVGLRGRPFRLYKFRTMIVGAEEIKNKLEVCNIMDGPVFKMRNDPRVISLGNFLRQTGLDELPQLVNVLKGEMSLIGPRPPLKEATLHYKPWQLRRLSVKPGLSCFWQVKPDRNSIKFEKWMELDLAYIDNWSIRLDLIIFLKTIKTVFQRSGI